MSSSGMIGGMKRGNAYDARTCAARLKSLNQNDPRDGGGRQEAADRLTQHTCISADTTMAIATMNTV
jgi:hypothetical protein